MSVRRTGGSGPERSGGADPKKENSKAEQKNKVGKIQGKSVKQEFNQRRLLLKEVQISPSLPKKPGSFGRDAVVLSGSVVTEKTKTNFTHLAGQYIQVRNSGDLDE